MKASIKLFKCRNIFLFVVWLLMSYKFFVWNNWIGIRQN
jgi:hypothetical protein